MCEGLYIFQYRDLRLLLGDVVHTPVEHSGSRIVEAKSIARSGIGLARKACTIYVEVSRCSTVISCEAVIVELAAGKICFDVRLDIFEYVGREHTVEVQMKLL